MSQQPITHTFQLPDGRSISIETGKLAKQADGAVVVRMGNCMLLATVCSKTEAKEGADFLPLSVDYQEKFAAAGRFPGGFFKREARLSEYEILISRLIDRALRPLFPDDYHADTQVMVTLMSIDENVMPDSLAGLAASAAICVSDIPFNGPVSEVRVARIDGKFVINPIVKDIERADIDLMVAGSIDNIVMVEGEMKEAGEADMVEAIRLGHEAIIVQCNAQIELMALLGNKPKRVYNHETHDDELKAKIHAELYDKAYAVALTGNPDKHARKEAFNKIVEEFIAQFPEDQLAEKASLINKYYGDVEYNAVRNAILNEGKRLDGRTTTTIRNIASEVNYLPSSHGSALFTRGETQSLTTVTLGSKLDTQDLDGAMFTGERKFLLHYNFPAFSTGEVKPNRGQSRREVGHGNLAWRALKQMMPGDDQNPYTVRVVSDILESNGSSSMATVCAGSLALMDAGVQMKKTVAGIAMGLITDESKRYAVLSDILGDEDHLGDMDFKVAGTKDGICGVQMDLKIAGLSFEVLTQALEQARQGRLHIINEMEKTMTQPNTDMKPHAPRIIELVIDREMIGAVIGPGGKIIQEIQRESGTTISIEEKDNKGYVQIMATDKDGMDKALSRVRGITAVPEVGAVYEGKVKSIQAYGAFVEILPGKDGLLHISEVSHDRLTSLEGILKEGDKIKVKLVDVDAKTGKFKLSHKVLLSKPEGGSSNAGGGIHSGQSHQSREHAPKGDSNGQSRPPRKPAENK